MDFFQIACFRERNMSVERNLKITINVNRKLWLPVIKLVKKHLPNQVVPITYTPKKLFEVATFEGLSVVSFQIV